jgi:putative membrane protein
MKTIFAVILAAVIALVAVQAQAQMGMPAVDRGVMLEAASGGMAEVELGRLAAQRASSDTVRQFGQRMMTDHGAANQELLQLAQRKGVALPQQPDAKHRAAIDRLATMSGAQFDQAYMTEMVKDHQADAAVFEREIREGQDAEVRAWASKVLATVREHQRLAGDIHSRMAQVPVAVVPVPAASPATTVTTITTTTAVTPLPPFCGGSYLPGVGTNFGSCR